MIFILNEIQFIKESKFVFEQTIECEKSGCEFGVFFSTASDIFLIFRVHRLAESESSCVLSSSHSYASYLFIIIIELKARLLDWLDLMTFKVSLNPKISMSQEKTKYKKPTFNHNKVSQAKKQRWRGGFNNIFVSLSIYVCWLNV